MADSEDITNIALRRSIFYPAAEIYSNSPSGFWEFGPVGEAIRRKIIEFWRKEFVQKEGFAEIYGAQILPEAVFKASGHLINFNDPVAQCKKCKSLHRADQLIAEKIKELGFSIKLVSVTNFLPSLTSGASMPLNIGSVNFPTGFPLYIS